MFEINIDTKRIISISNPGADITGYLYNNIFNNGIYIPATVTSLPDAISGLLSLNFSGASVSMPYKQEIIKHLDKIDDSANTIGAVNTVLVENGKVLGFNTDWIGALKPVNYFWDKESIKSKRVLVLGAGGAAKAIIYGLNKYGFEITIANRSYEKAKVIAKKYDCSFSKIDEIENIGFDLIVNATSYEFLDVASGKILISKEIIKKSKLVLDAVFSPTETSLVLYAKSIGIPVICGHEMLVYQAIAQAEIWNIKTDMEPVTLIKSLEGYLQGKSNGKHG